MENGSDAKAFAIGDEFQYLRAASVADYCSLNGTGGGRECGHGSNCALIVNACDENWLRPLRVRRKA